MIIVDKEKVIVYGELPTLLAELTMACMRLKDIIEKIEGENNANEAIYKCSAMAIKQSGEYDTKTKIKNNKLSQLLKIINALERDGK